MKPCPKCCKQAWKYKADVTSPAEGRRKTTVTATCACGHTFSWSKEKKLSTKAAATTGWVTPPKGAGAYVLIQKGKCFDVVWQKQ